MISQNKFEKIKRARRAAEAEHPDMQIIDLGVDFEIIKKSGSWFSYGDRKIGQGRDAVKEALKNDAALMEEIELRVRDAMQEHRNE